MNETLNNSPPTPEGSNYLPDTVPIQDLDQFVSFLSVWHSDKVKTCRQLLAVPQNTVFTVGEEELVLDEKALAGFKFGIEMALMQLGELPFVAELEDAPAEVVPG